jgi:hypothetical protein
VVFRGYAAAVSAAGSGRVVVRPPQHSAVSFELPPGSPLTLVVEHDPSGEWELPYYRSMLEADGVVCVGGGRSTRIAGLFALIHGIPVLPVATFGGGAAQVRTNLNSIRNDATDEDIKLLGRPWTDGLGTELVASLLAQRERRRQRLADEALRSGRRAWGNRSALLVTAVALVVTWLAVPLAESGQPTAARGFALLLAVPMVAAVGGALLRNSCQYDHWGWSAVRGLAAGLVTVFLYLAGEYMSVPDLLDRLDVQRLLLFLAPLGFIAGFTFDKVLDSVLKGQTKVSSAGANQPPAA